MIDEESERLSRLGLLDEEERTTCADGVSIEHVGWRVAEERCPRGRVVLFFVDFVEIGIEPEVLGAQLDGACVITGRALKIVFDMPAVDAEIAQQHGIFEFLIERGGP